MKAVLDVNKPVAEGNHVKGITWAESHLQENVLEFPSTHPDWAFRAPVRLGYRPKAGCLAVRVYPPREVTEGGVYLPSAGDGYEHGAAAERVRADCGQVLAVGEVPDGWNTGTKQRESALLLAQTLDPGDVIMMRPYSGAQTPAYVLEDGSVVFDFPGFGVTSERIDVRWLGQTDPWSEDVVMVLEQLAVSGQELAGLETRLKPGEMLVFVGGTLKVEWRCVTNWCALDMDDLLASKTVVSNRHIYSGTGMMLDCGPWVKGRQIGDRVATANDMHLQSCDDVKWLRTKWGEWDERVLLVRQRDYAGTQRVFTDCLLVD